MLSEQSLRKLEGIRKCISGGHRVRNLFQIAMSMPDLWELAYANIAPNQGAMTAGVDGQTIDGKLPDNKYLLNNKMESGVR